MEAQGRLVWFKGDIVDVNDAQISVLSPSAQFGVNVFEGIRAYWNESTNELLVFRLDDHLSRLRESCRILRITPPYSDSEILDAVNRVVSANAYCCDLAMRLIVFVDDEGTWHSSEPVNMVIAPITRERGTLESGSGLRVCVSRWERINDSSLSPRAKVGANYVNGRYAHLDARASGYDTALMLDRRGFVSEGPGACIMLVKNDQLITPPVTASILDSITRDTLLELARQSGLDAQARDVIPTELYSADEIFLCGTAAEVMPILEVDGIPIGRGVVGEMTRRLHREYIRAVTGELQNRTNWCRTLNGSINSD